MACREAENVLRPGSIAAGDGSDAGEREPFEVDAHVISCLVPDAEQDALSLVVARAILVRLAEVAERDRTVDGRHDLGETDVGGVASEDVAAPDTAFGLDESGAFEREQNLLEVRLGERGAVGDVAYRCGPRFVGVQRERQQGTAGVVTAGRDAHMTTLVIRPGKLSF